MLVRGAPNTIVAAPAVATIAGRGPVVAPRGRGRGRGRAPFQRREGGAPVQTYALRDDLRDADVTTGGGSMKTEGVFGLLC